MVALLRNNEYFIGGHKNINEFLTAYAEHIGAVDMKVFRVLANSNEMSTKELVEYINNQSYSWEDEIAEIYEIGKKIY